MASLKGFYTPEKKERKLTFKVVNLRTKRQLINKIDTLRQVRGQAPSGYADIIDSISTNLLKAELAELKQVLDYCHN